MKKFRTNKVNRNLSSGVVYANPRGRSEARDYIHIYIYVYMYREARIRNRLGL